MNKRQNEKLVEQCLAAWKDTPHTDAYTNMLKTYNRFRQLEVDRGNRQAQAINRQKESK